MPSQSGQNYGSYHSMGVNVRFSMSAGCTISSHNPDHNYKMWGIQLEESCSEREQV